MSSLSINNGHSFLRTHSLNTHSLQIDLDRPKKPEVDLQPALEPLRSEHRFGPIATHHSNRQTKLKDNQKSDLTEENNSSMALDRAMQRIKHRDAKLRKRKCPYLLKESEE